MRLYIGCVIAMTGETDWISDGNITISSTNGDKLLAHITGSGCIVGTSVATFCAAANLTATRTEAELDRLLVRGDMLLGSIAGYVLLVGLYAILLTTICNVLKTESSPSPLHLNWQRVEMMLREQGPSSRH